MENVEINFGGTAPPFPDDIDDVINVVVVEGDDNGGSLEGGGFRVLACADTLARTPLACANIDLGTLLYVDWDLCNYTLA